MNNSRPVNAKTLIIDHLAGAKTGKLANTRREVSLLVAAVAAVALLAGCSDTKPLAYGSTAAGGSDVSTAISKAGLVPGLQCPLINGCTKSGFGHGSTWFASVQCGGKPKLHVGVDLAAHAGDSVRAVADGTVAAIYAAGTAPDGTDWKKGVVIKSGAEGEWTWTVIHVATTLSVGDLVTRGVEMATVADLGGSTHLHLGARDAPYADVAKRGALPDPSVGSTCAGDPAYPEQTVDPVPLIVNE